MHSKKLFTLFTVLGMIGASAHASKKKIQPVPLTPELCERAILDPNTDYLRLEVVISMINLSSYLFKPVNYADVPVRLEDMDHDFAAAQLGPDATKKNVAAAYDEAWARLKRIGQTPDIARATSGTFSDLQAGAAGVGKDLPYSLDDLESTAHVSQNETLVLSTYHPERPGEILGRVELDLKGVRLGYNDLIDHWIFEHESRRGRRAPAANLSAFLMAHGVAVLRPNDPKSIYAYVTSLEELQGISEKGEVRIEAHVVREVDPNYAETMRLKLPPLRRANGKALAFTPTGLRWMSARVIPADEASNK